MTVEASTALGANPVTGAIRKAARATGANFQYLLATARVESDLNPDLTMRSSTATGLFQFIEQTWLATLKQAGPAFGYGHYADAISVSGSRYSVEDRELRAEIMQLRKDPTANALMGGVFTQQNAAVLAGRLGRRPSERELYIGHFFGPYAGSKAITLAADNPNLVAAELFPAAAQANRPIFYDKQGAPRTIGAVCAELGRRYQVARDQGVASSAAMASDMPLRPPVSVPARPPGADAGAPVAIVPSGSFSASAPLSNVLAYSTSPESTEPGTTAASTGPIFHSLFITGERREAISPAISELWGSKTPAR